jgi:hypothetical protein
LPIEELAMTHRAFRFAFVMMTLALMGLMSSVAQANGVPLIYQPLNPAAVAPGSPAFTLTVNGTGFVSGAVANWNGSARATTFVSSSQLTAAITAADIATAGTATITVTNPAPGGGTSNGVFFQVTNPTVGLAFHESVFPTGSSVTISQPAVGDFNGDGKLDVAVAVITGTVRIFLGNGDGSFQAPVVIQAAPAGADIYDITVGDFNGDGKPDLVLSYSDLNVSPVVTGKSVLLGNGDGTFQPFKLSPNIVLGNMTIVADVNGDGKPDLVSACQVGVCIALGNGDGTFQPGFVWTSPVNVNGGPKAMSLTVGDFNGDGKLDIALLAIPKYLVVLFGNGDGTFGPPSIIYDTGFGGDSVVAADFNGDGKLDLALYYQQNTPFANSGTLSIFLGNGDGTFQAPRTLTGLPETIDSTVLVPGDFNGDGHLDLAAQTLAILIGNGSGTFSHSELPLPHFASVAGDFNGDGRLDLVSTDNSQQHQLHVMLQTAPSPDFTGSVTPTFQTVVTGSSANYSISISAIDGFSGTIQFSLTGLPAGATASFNPPTVTGSGTTTLTVSTSSSTPTGSYTLAVGGTSASVAHQGTLTLNVGPAGSDFTDFSGSITPSYQTITPGSSTGYNLAVTPINGFTGNVTLTVSGLPAGATGIFNPATITGGSGSSLLSISTSSSTATGSYVLTITATSGSHVHSTTVNLNVGPAGTDFTDFTGSITPSSQTVRIGSSTSFTLTIQPINGFSQDVNLSQLGTPTGVFISASTQVIVGGSGSSVITFSPQTNATPGTYTITITANGGLNHVHSKNITLTVTP